MHLCGGQTDASDFLGTLPSMSALRPRVGSDAATSILGGELTCRRGPTSACGRCGGTVRLRYETVPYLAVGPRVVELRNVAVRRCSACGHMGLEVPDVRALDVLVRCFCVESAHVPRLGHTDGRWRILVSAGGSDGR